MQLRVLALGALSAALFVPGALGSALGSARPNTTVPQVFVPIQVTITDSRISLNRRSANRGDAVRFTIRNAGTRVHGFTLGNPQRSVGTQVGFSATLKPNQEKLYLLFLDYRGALQYRSTIKADLKKPGMRGIFKIL
jgi:hypothetical protein